MSAAPAGQPPLSMSRPGTITVSSSPTSAPICHASTRPMIARRAPGVRSLELPLRAGSARSTIRSLRPPDRCRAARRLQCRSARASPARPRTARRPPCPARRVRVGDRPPVAIRSGGPDTVACAVSETSRFAQFALEAVHDRNDGDQRRDAETHPGHRHPGDERDEKALPAGADVTQANEDGQRVEHARSWRKAARLPADNPVLHAARARQGRAGKPEPGHAPAATPVLYWPALHSRRP